MHRGTSKVQKAAVGYGNIKCKQLTLKMRKLEVWTIGYFLKVQPQVFVKLLIKTLAQ